MCLHQRTPNVQLSKQVLPKSFEKLNFSRGNLRRTERKDYLKMSRDPNFKPRIKTANIGSSAGKPGVGVVGTHGQPTKNRVNKDILPNMNNEQSQKRGNGRQGSKKNESSQSISDILSSLDCPDLSESEVEEINTNYDVAQSVRVRNNSEGQEENRGKRSTAKKHWKFPASDWCISPKGKKVQYTIQPVGPDKIIKPSPAKDSPNSQKEVKDDLPCKSTEGNALWQLKQIATVGFVRPISFDIPGEWKVAKKIKLLAQKHAAKRRKNEALKIESRFNAAKIKPFVKMKKLNILTVDDCSKRPKTVKVHSRKEQSRGGMKAAISRVKKEPIAAKRKREKVQKDALKKGSKNLNGTPAKEEDDVIVTAQEPASKRQRKVPSIYKDFVTPVQAIKKEEEVKEEVDENLMRYKIAEPKKEEKAEVIHELDEVDENLIRYKIADPALLKEVKKRAVNKENKLPIKKGKENKDVAKRKISAQQIRKKLKQAQKVKQNKVMRKKKEYFDENLVRYKIVKVQEIRKPMVNKQRKALLKKAKENEGVKNKKEAAQRLKRKLQREDSVVRYKIITVKELRKPTVGTKRKQTKGNENKAKGVKSSKILKREIIKKLKQTEEEYQKRLLRKKRAKNVKSKVALKRGPKAGNAAKLVRGFIKQEKKNDDQKARSSRASETKARIHVPRNSSPETASDTAELASSSGSETPRKIGRPVKYSTPEERLEKRRESKLRHYHKSKGNMSQYLFLSKRCQSETRKREPLSNRSSVRKGLRRKPNPIPPSSMPDLLTVKQEEQSSDDQSKMSVPIQPYRIFLSKNSRTETLHTPLKIEPPSSQSPAYERSHSDDDPIPQTSAAHVATNLVIKEEKESRTQKVKVSGSTKSKVRICVRLSLSVLMIIPYNVFKKKTYMYQMLNLRVISMLP